MGNFDRGNRGGRDRFGGGGSRGGRDFGGSRGGYGSPRFGGEAGGGERRDFNSPRSDRFGAGRDDREMFQAVCDKCGKSCEVPFKPTSGKPVFCRDCFRENSESGARPERSFSRPSFESRSDGGARPAQSNDQFEKLNQKLDKILKILESVEIEETPEEFNSAPVEEVPAEEEVVDEVSQPEELSDENPESEEIAPAPKKRSSKKSA